MGLRIIAGIILGIWIVLVLLGKGGLVHILLLNVIGIAFVDLLTIYRTRLSG